MELDQIGIEEIKKNFESFIDKIESGHKIIITKKGEPIAEIKPFKSNHLRTRPFGLCKGEFIVPDDFDEPLSEEILNLFECR